MYKSGGTLFCHCDLCGREENFDISLLKYENGYTGYSECPICEMSVCWECEEENKHKDR